jgi:hypothetical protein
MRHSGKSGGWSGTGAVEGLLLQGEVGFNGQGIKGRDQYFQLLKHVYLYLCYM